MEWSKWSAEAEPEHNVTLPFTRMFLGPMDYTPGAMLNAHERQLRPDLQPPHGARHALPSTGDVRGVTRARLQMLSDSPSNYLREPEAMEFLAAVPTRVG